MISTTNVALALCLAKFGDIMVTLLWISTGKQQKQNLQSCASAILGYNALKSKLRFYRIARRASFVCGFHSIHCEQTTLI